MKLYIREYDHNYTGRTLQGLGNRTIGCVPFADPQVDPPKLHEVEYEKHLLGLLRRYHRKTA